MKLRLTITFFIWVLLYGTTHAGGILVVQSRQAKPFHEALNGFLSTCRSADVEIFSLDKSTVEISQHVLAKRPELILAIGTQALASLKHVKSTPVLYLLALDAQKMANGANMTGVRMDVSPKKYIEIIEKIGPNAKVAILHSAYSESKAAKIARLAETKGIKTAVFDIHDPKNLPEKLEALENRFNVLLMLPDPHITQEMAENLISFSQRHGIPLIAFAGKYVDMGALAAPEFDYFDMGRQAGEMANRVLAHGHITYIPPRFPRRAVIKTNAAVCKRLGVDL